MVYSSYPSAVVSLDTVLAGLSSDTYLFLLLLQLFANLIQLDLQVLLALVQQVTQLEHQTQPCQQASKPLNQNTKQSCDQVMSFNIN